jgi:hypothetical protein
VLPSPVSAIAGYGFFWFASPSPVISLSLAYTLLLFYLIVIQCFGFIFLRLGEVSTF